LSFKRKNWIKTLSLEAETAISLLPTQEQDHIRFQVAHNIKQLYKQYDSTEQYNSNHAKNEYKAINKIKEKLERNNALALKADKGNSIVIVYADNYHNKVQEFITNNSFTIVDKDPTERFQNKIRTIIRECKNIIHTDKRSKYVNLNPTAPTIRGLPKVHKENCPIRPIIDWQNTPAYKLAKLLNKLIQSHMPLP
jgi:predicted O-linked N-acetylglucosamine transferase (SPINDLY family)